MKAYPQYKDSGVPWLGDVPEHWETIKTKHLFRERVQKGYPDEPLLAATQTKGVIPKSMYENRTVEAQKDLHLLKLVEIGDFVVSLRSFQGGIEYTYYRGIISPAYTVMVPNKRILSEYYKHLAKSKKFISLLQTCVTGIREGQNINYEILRKTPLPIPPQEEQQQISRYLDWQTSKINKFIRAKKKLIALLKEQKQNIINEAVTKGIYPNVKMKDSGVEWLGEIPAHWEVRRIKSLTQVKRGASPRPIVDEKFFDEKGEYAWVRISDVTTNGKYLKNTTQRLSELGKSKSVPLQSGSIFLSIAGSVGKPIITKIKCCIHDGFVYFPNYKDDVEYLYYVFLSGNIWDGLGKLGTQLNLNTATVGAVSIGLPQLEEQKSIVANIEKETALIDKTISRAERELELIQEYRTRLVSDIVTGKIDVRSIEIPDFEPLEADVEVQDTEEESEDELITEGIEA